MVVNKDDGTGEAQRFAEAAGIPVLASIPADEEIRRKSASYQIVGRPDSPWGPLFEGLAANLAAAPPRQPSPLGQEALLALFAGRDAGAHIVMEPATAEDMRGAAVAEKPSLEVIYDEP
jgi:chlorophyllide a reductase subunit X